jgi:GNAT superfamily N-acetyltransferase
MEIPAGPLLEQVLDDTYPLWGDGLTRKAYGQWNLAQMKTAWGREHLHRVGLVEGDEVVVSAKRYLFDGLVEGRPEKVLGIGAVFTPERRRGQHLAPRLIEAMLADGQARGCTLAVLFSEIGAPYYERLGFTAISRTLVTIDIPRTRRGAPGTMVRAVTPADLPEIADISMAYATGAGVALNRTAEFIEFSLTRHRLRAGLGPLGLRELEVFVAEEGYRAAAYIVVSRGPDGVVLEECGDRDPRGSRIGAMLEALVERDPSNPDRNLRAWLPPGLHPPQVQLLDPTPAPEVMMVRALSGSSCAPVTHSVWWSTDIF